ncbi:hypothetical protein L228DRAFT_237075 [Xylona heveae TC161]|uniref:SNF2 N-terminal domain-containing protein n=1 Tax=Xylona heveae (strain CBS 132557 / TC161) TaxID=1328760 RepID=A0A165HYX1_XYLHT|nr:hypothetical protein L228DRAFT_237075 [Xylona heveae TC161]KZF24114.1 hypothetical protein L228DRAFT_237075 [Xylona heveae TC161]
MLLECCLEKLKISNNEALYIFTKHKAYLNNILYQHKDHDAAFLADVISLGKTWIRIDWLLHKINERQSLLQEGMPPKAMAKPFLVIVSSNLVKQWMKQILYVMDNILVYMYYGDYYKK